MLVVVALVQFGGDLRNNRAIMLDCQWDSLPIIGRDASFHVGLLKHSAICGPAQREMKCWWCL